MFWDWLADGMELGVKAFAAMATFSVMGLAILGVIGIIASFVKVNDKGDVKKND